MIAQQLYDLLWKGASLEWTQIHEQTLQFLILEAATHQALHLIHLSSPVKIEWINQDWLYISGKRVQTVSLDLSDFIPAASKMQINNILSGRRACLLIAWLLSYQVSNVWHSFT